MEQEEIIQLCKSFVREKFSNEPTGHDWFHIERVFKLSEYIAKREVCDVFEVQLTALFHDVADWKFTVNSEAETQRIVHDFLEPFHVDKQLVDRVVDNISQISYKGAGTQTIPRTKEAQIVQDADRLEALGAIGIARAFAYGGNKLREIYNPDVPPVMHQTFEDYKKSKGTTINHFYEKLLLLKDLMNTDTGRNIAEERHAFMQLFLQKFYDEWEVRLNENE